METWADRLKAAGIAQRRVSEITGRDPGEVCRRLNGYLPMTGDMEAACRRLEHAARVAKAREGLAAAAELLGRL